MPSALNPGTVAAPFTLTLCSAQEVTLVEFPESQASVVGGAWAAEGGGCNLYNTWTANPKFLLTVSEAGSFKVGRCRLTR